MFEHFRFLKHLRCTPALNTFLITLGAVALGTSTAHAFPDRPITLVVAFAPGTGSDVVARMLAKGMAVALGQAVIVDNRPGAGGVVGTDAVARAPGDGYTLALATTSTLITAPLLNASARYDARRDFAAVSGVGQLPFVIVTSARPPAPKTLAELAEKLRAGPTTFASAGQGTITHLASEMFVAQARAASATHVAYRGSGPALTDVASGQVLFASDTLAGALPLIRSGLLKALAVTSPQRVASLPDVPTTREAGFPALKPQAWLSLMAPAGTPAAVRDKLSAAAATALASPEVRESLLLQEVMPMPLSPKEFDALLRDEIPVWTELVKRLDIQPGK